MASKYAGTKTEQNLKDAFSGESQARNKYTYYASAAKKAGYEQMSALYLETADQEKEHAKMWFKELHGIGTPEENLADAAAGENYEWTDMYARMAREAREEGFEELAVKFEMCIRDRSSAAPFPGRKKSLKGAVQTAQEMDCCPGPLCKLRHSGSIKIPQFCRR